MPGYAADYINKKCVKTLNCEDNCDVCKITGNTTTNVSTTSYAMDSATNSLKEDIVVT